MSSENLFDNLKLNPENMKNIKDKAAEIQSQMSQVQQMLTMLEVEGSAGIENYNVKIIMNGRHEATKVIVDPKLLAQPIQVLCELVASAITDASHKTEIAIQTKMAGLFKNINFPK